MNMKTFEADTMQEALLMVKDELGPEAVILRSRKKTKKVLGRSREVVEVTAALEDGLFAKPDPIASTSVQSPSAVPAMGHAAYGRSAPPRAAANAMPAQTSLPDAVEPPVNVLELLKAELREMKECVEMPTRELRNLKEELAKMLAGAAAAPAQPQPSQRLQSMGPLPAGFSAMACVLEEADVETGLIQELIGRLETLIPKPERHDAQKALRIASRVMANRLRCAGEIRYNNRRSTVVMLVGPTGVGKTTTIAKLAGVEHFQKGRKVAIISADSFRMGAAEQIKTFGQASGIPVEAVFGDEDMQAALERYKSMDLILVDTAGRSHSHAEMWNELRLLVPKVVPDELHLVLSCTSRPKELYHAYDLYREIGANRVIFTKLDECVSLGPIYNLACRRDAEISFLCDGQQIPENIRPARPEEAASLILKGQGDIVAGQADA